MAKTKVYAPNREYAGSFGDVRFEAGVAEVPDDSPLMGYFQRRGYGVGKPAAELYDAEKDVEWPDPHTHKDESFGSPLRDAAVDPEPEDYLAPVNAGKAHPHSSKVVSPGIHTVGPAPIRPGEVYVDDVARQEAEELELAKRVLVDSEPATIVASDEGPGGPLGLSDPGSVEMGIRGAREVHETEAAGTGAPAKSASKADWVEHAVSRGMSREEAEDMSKADLQERLG
jgi:hypothetical protein